MFYEYISLNIISFSSFMIFLHFCLSFGKSSLLSCTGIESATLDYDECLDFRAKMNAINRFLMLNRVGGIYNRNFYISLLTVSWIRASFD